jgi:hypothetical protein
MPKIEDLFCQKIDKNHDCSLLRGCDFESVFGSLAPAWWFQFSLGFARLFVLPCFLFHRRFLWEQRQRNVPSHISIG